eukprot:13633463-Ditylum_brightwellii.AAC.1
MEEDYEKGDNIIWMFWKTVHGQVDTAHAKLLWTFIRQLAAHNGRLLAALPSDPNDIPKAIKLGTAMLSVPNVVRTSEWLEKNGQCLDNIRPGQSTLEQAGR